VRLSYEEFLMWESYVAKRGSLNLGLRLENGIALIATLIKRAQGIDTEISEFMPHFDAQPISLEQAMQQWS
jgi:hypothetical protein